MRLMELIQTLVLLTVLFGFVVGGGSGQSVSAPNMSQSNAPSPSTFPSRSSQPSASVAPSVTPSFSSPSEPPAITQTLVPTLIPSFSTQPTDATSVSTPIPSPSPGRDEGQQIITVSPTIFFIQPSFETASPSASAARSEATDAPSTTHSIGPSILPSQTPSVSLFPSTLPTTSQPTLTPQPSPSPSLHPTELPSNLPSRLPSQSFAPSISQLPSHLPSIVPSAAPTETIAPSPSPTTIPSVTPSTSIHPSARPSLSFEPSLSIHPSAGPSGLPSFVPSGHPTYTPSSQQPSSIPSIEPTKLPSISPSLLPTTYPSASPTVTMLSMNLNELRLMFQGLPILTSKSNIGYWENITGDHVLTYWNPRPVPGVIIARVLTTLVDQIVVARGDPKDGDTVEFTYNQQITYGFLNKESTILDNEEVLFFRPFSLDSQRYADALQRTIKHNSIDSEILVLGTPGDLLPTEVPSFPPSAAPSTAPIPTQPLRAGTDTTTVVVIIVSVAVALMAVFAVWYFTSGRSAVSKDLPQDYYHESYPQTPISHVSAPAVPAYSAESDIDLYTAVTRSYILTGAFNDHDIALEKQTDTGGDVMMVGNARLNTGSLDPHNRDSETPNHNEHGEEIVVPLPQFEDSSVDTDNEMGPPSILGFHMTVTEIEDDGE